MRKDIGVSSALGADFWHFRIGQLVSLLGDSCGNIAMAWWILEKTGSAAQMSMVLAPAMLVRIILLPLLGPIGDKVSRKKLILAADIWRLAMGIVLAGMVYADYFHQIVLTLVFTLMAVGSALFFAAAGPIIPQIVAREHLHTAMQQTQAINATAGVIGGIVGGVAVSTIGVLGAFILDALSYLVAAFCSGRIKADTRPNPAPRVIGTSPMRQWLGELGDGLRVLSKIPLLIWLLLNAMVINFALAPLAIVLPVLAKESRGMPAWYLGGLESSISLGAIIGALMMPIVLRRYHAHTAMIWSLILIGLGVLVLPWPLNPYLAMGILLLVGIGSSCASIPLASQMSLAIPTQYQARLGTLRQFVSSGMSPLGVAGIGALIASIGLNMSLVLMGGMVAVLAPLMLWVPHLRDFMGASHQEAGDFLEKRFPGAFREVR